MTDHPESPSDKKRAPDRRAYFAAYRAAHKDERRAYNAAYNAIHRDQRRAYMAVYNAAYNVAHKAELRARDAVRRATGNKDEIRASAAARYAANRDKQRAYAVAYYAAHKDDARAYRIAHKEKCRAYHIAHRGANPDKHREIKYRYLARKLKAPGQFTAADWRTLVLRSPNCHWCKKKFTKTCRPTHDHVIPLSKGGSNSPENSVCACKLCNCTKNNRLVNPATGQGILL